jgi:glyoxylase I family protein
MMSDPPTAAKWYCEHLGMRVARCMDKPPYTQFLADAGGNVMLEIYTNSEAKKADVPEYRDWDPLLLHVAFSSTDIEADRQRLIDAGATADGDIAVTPAGDRLAMLRDPWGFCAQLVERDDPML